MNTHQKELLRFLTHLPVDQNKLERAAESILDCDQDEDQLKLLVNANTAFLQRSLPPALQFPLEMMKASTYHALDAFSGNDLLEIAQELEFAAKRANSQTESSMRKCSSKNLLLARILSLLAQTEKECPAFRAYAFTEIMRCSKLSPVVQLDALKLEFPSNDRLEYWNSL